MENRGRPEKGNTMLPLLSDLGITKMQSSRWQATARVRLRVELGLPIFCPGDAKDQIAERGEEHLEIARRWKKGGVSDARYSGNQPILAGIG